MGFQDDYLKTLKIDKPLLEQSKLASQMMEQYNNAMTLEMKESLLEANKVINNLVAFNNMQTYSAMAATMRNVEQLISSVPKESIAKNALGVSALPKSYNFSIVSRSIAAFNEMIVSAIPEDETEGEKEEIFDTETKILTEIYSEHSNAEINTNATIILSPVNDKVLRYLADNPKDLYNLTPDDFENVMTEIYRRLGFDVEKTQKTRDGGKDIIIRKPSELGNFIYYVECKKYSEKRPIGTGIVRAMVGTVDVDKINGGIIATTSYFSRDARKFISENGLQCKIQMHDYKKIQHLLNSVV